MSEQESPAPSTIESLRKRKLVQWAAGYAAVAWVALQLLTLVGQQFDWSPALLRTITIALGLGFFVTVVLAWFHGERGEQRVTLGEIAILAVVVALGAGLMWRTVLSPQPAASNAPVAASAGQVEAPPPPVSKKSIAVLPFADLSPNHDQEYFSDGMAEELLNALAKVKDLKVAGRTSSFQFKGRSEDLRAIGRELGVAHVLEGSVRKQGDKVRITAQLIQAADGFHLWSETFDGDLSDVFALQERIARAITEQLQVVIEGGSDKGLVQTGTRNPAAYALYLQATAVFNQRDGARMQSAVEALEEALRLDPGYARAQARLASMYVVLPVYANYDWKAARERVLAHAAEASRLDPTLAEPYAAIGFFNGQYPGHLVEGRDALERALALEPDDVTTNFWSGLFLVKTGYQKRGFALMDRALELDPMLPNGLRWRANGYAYAGDAARAEQMWTRARDVGLLTAERELADALAARGQTEAAIEEYARGATNIFAGDPGRDPKVIPRGLYGDSAAKARALASVDEYFATERPQISGLLAVAIWRLGRPAQAMQLLADGRLNDNSDISGRLFSPRGRELRQMPEFQALLRAFGHPALWDRYGPPDVCHKAADGSYACD